jgi:hypothetical protein
MALRSGGSLRLALDRRACNSSLCSLVCKGVGTQMPSQQDTSSLKYSQLSQQRCSNSRVSPLSQL